MKPWGHLLEAKADDAFRRLERAALSNTADGDTIVRYLRELNRRGQNPPIDQIIDLVVGRNVVATYRRVAKILKALRDSRSLGLIFNANYPFDQPDGVAFLAHVFDVVDDGRIPGLSLDVVLRAVRLWLRRDAPGELNRGEDQAMYQYLRFGGPEWESDSLHAYDGESVIRINGIPYPTDIADVNRYNLRIGNVLHAAEINRRGGGVTINYGNYGPVLDVYLTAAALNEAWDNWTEHYEQMDADGRQQTINDFANEISGVNEEDVEDAVRHDDLDDTHWSEWDRDDIMRALRSLAEHSVDVGVARYGRQLQLFSNKDRLEDALRKGIESDKLRHNVERWTRAEVEQVWADYTANRPRRDK